MAFLESFDAASTTLLVTVVGAFVTYLFNERGRRHGLRVEKNSERRLAAYADLIENSRDFRRVTVQVFHALELRDTSKPLPERLGVAGSLHSLIAMGGDVLPAELPAPPHDEETVDRFWMAAFPLVQRRLGKRFRSAQQALTLCRLLVLDASLRDQLKEFEKVLTDGWMATAEMDNALLEANHGTLVAKERELEAALAENYGGDFMG